MSGENLTGWRKGLPHFLHQGVPSKNRRYSYFRETRRNKALHIILRKFQGLVKTVHIKKLATVTRSMQYGIRTLSDLTRARTGGGGDVTPSPHEFFWNGRRTTGRIALKLCTAYVASLAKLLAKNNWPGQVRSPSYDVIRGTASDRFFKKVVFSAM